MRFPSRPVLAASVCAALAASGGTVLTMPQQPADAADLALGRTAATGLGAPQSPDVSTVAGPPVSGAQIAGLALAPARERASTLISERAAAAAAARAAAEEQAREEAERRKEAEAEQERPRRSGNSDWEEFRRELREACDDGRIRGQICRGA